MGAIPRRNPTNLFALALVLKMSNQLMSPSEAGKTEIVEKSSFRG
jgi:hypothetical protein